MNILGLNYYFHDSAACVVRDGNLICAIEEERLSRNKHSREFPRLSIGKCLELAGLDYSDVERIAVSIQPSRNWLRRSAYAFSKPRYFKAIFRHEAAHAVARQSAFWNWYKIHWPKRRHGARVHFVPHHLSPCPRQFSGVAVRRGGSAGN